MTKKAKNGGKQSPEAVKFSQVSKFLKIVSDENRLKILLVLESGSLNVTEIHNKLKLPQNLTSHHISKLKSLDLLVEKREGVFRHYSVNTKNLKEYNRLFKELMKI
ncbi:MAG: putative response regulator of the arsR family [Candidatus Moranbacteria bacterium GW2011_GWE1_36_7]|nr:MAG: putative response regulator of the arsR family [Candidatus Moranbacteria bacterium GW2011_GWD2_36_12]KKQ05143.1 MAG: putative response regulator of the arsR family [Candidatus Moranbacteria bacterium GW2011_GWE2_36_40]KKQ14715.1 MAG: putative response regulator of the arsR family [Candidatus Moranbacteria bacterium GW2011_GWE1_36_7]